MRIGEDPNGTEWTGQDRQEATMAEKNQIEISIKGRREKNESGDSLTDEQARQVHSIFHKMAGEKWQETLKPKAILDAVLGDTKHPLRAYYEWDVKKAARAHWLDRTRWLLQQVTIHAICFRGTPREMVVESRAFVNAPATASRERGYRPIAEVMKEESSDAWQTKRWLGELKQWHTMATVTATMLEASGRPPHGLQAMLRTVAKAIAEGEATLASTKAA
jgi:hypothetical protein